MQKSHFSAYLGVCMWLVYQHGVKYNVKTREKESDVLRGGGGGGVCQRIKIIAGFDSSIEYK